MLTLREQQQALLEILLGHAAAAESAEPHPSRAGLATDPWLSSVLGSPGLRILRRTASWWQRFQIESYCRLTSRLMKRLGCLEDYLEAHFAAHPAPPYIEELTAEFLTALSNHVNPLLRAVAQFELFCMAPADAPARSTEILWDRNPETVLVALARSLPLPGPESGVLYRLRLSSTEPVTCVRERYSEEPFRVAPSHLPLCGQNGACCGLCAKSAQGKSASSPA